MPHMQGVKLKLLIFQRAHNVFSKKVPKDAESCNLLVGTAAFIRRPLVIFVRLREAVVLEDFCEISALTRFLGIVLGPVGSESKIVDMGKALGTLMSDQVEKLVLQVCLCQCSLISDLPVHCVPRKMP